MTSMWTHVGQHNTRDTREGVLAGRSEGGEAGEMPVSGTRLAASAVAGVTAWGLELADGAAGTAKSAGAGADVRMIVIEAEGTDDEPGIGGAEIGGEERSGEPEQHRRRSIGREAKPT